MSNLADVEQPSRSFSNMERSYSVSGDGSISHQTPLQMGRHELYDNIPFTAAMIPILLGMEAQGIHVAPLWWALAAGVGMGGNGTHIGSTANVYIVTISERLAKNENDPSLAITPWTWFRYGTPAMIATLIVCSFIFYFFFDFYNAEFVSNPTAATAPTH